MARKKRSITYHKPPMKYQPGLNKYVVDLPTKPLPGEYQSPDKRIAVVTFVVIAVIVALIVLGYISTR